MTLFQTENHMKGENAKGAQVSHTGEWDLLPFLRARRLCDVLFSAPAAPRRPLPS